MTRSAALRRAKRYHDLARDPRTHPCERELAAEQLADLQKAFGITDQELGAPSSELVMIFVGMYRGEETDLCGIVVQVAGGALTHDAAGNLFLVCHPLELQRLKPLTEKLTALYRREVERMERASSDFKSFVFTTRMFTSSAWAPSIDKPSFLAGLTIGLIQRFSPPAPPASSTSTALVPLNIESRAYAAENQKPLTSQADFSAGLTVAMRANFATAAGELKGTS